MGLKSERRLQLCQLVPSAPPPPIDQLDLQVALNLAVRFNRRLELDPTGLGRVDGTSSDRNRRTIRQLSSSRPGLHSALLSRPPFSLSSILRNGRDPALRMGEPCRHSSPPSAPSRAARAASSSPCLRSLMHDSYHLRQGPPPETKTEAKVHCSKPRRLVELLN